MLKAREPGQLFTRIQNPVSKNTRLAPDKIFNLSASERGHLQCHTARSPHHNNFSWSKVNRKHVSYHLKFLINVSTFGQLHSYSVDLRTVAVFLACAPASGLLL